MFSKLKTNCDRKNHQVNQNCDRIFTFQQPIAIAHTLIMIGSNKVIDAEVYENPE